MPKRKYTDAEIESIIEQMVILVDTRENENSHIIKAFDNYKFKGGQIGINHKSMKLDSGDYSVMIPCIPELAIYRDIYFTNDILLERKNSLEELSANLTISRQRFENEFGRAKAPTIYMLIEHGSFYHIFTKNYKTDITSKAFINSIIAFEQRYGIHVHFVNDKIIGGFMFYVLRRFVIDWLGGDVDRFEMDL